MKTLQDIYDCNENLMECLQKEDGIAQNTAEHIMLSYDFQAGTYTESYYANPDEKRRFLQRLTDIIVSKRISGSLLEAGTGKGTSLVPLLQSLEQGGKSAFHEIYAFDIFWSRIKAAKEQFALEKNVTPPAMYRCPISKKQLKSYGDSFYCPDSMLAYPVIQGIPCLLPGNAIVETKYESKFDFKK